MTLRMNRYKRSVSNFCFVLLSGALAVLTITGHGLCVVADIVQDIQTKEAVVASQPGTVEAMDAQKELVNLYLEQGRTVEAKAAAAGLVEGYTELTGRAGSIQQAGEAFRYAGEYESMAQMHEYVAQQWPGSNEAMWSKRTVVLAELLAGKTEQADTTFDQLITGHSQAEELPQAIYWLGRDCLHEVKDMDRAQVYFGYVREHWPEHEYALRSYAGQASVYLNQGQEEKVQECLDAIRTEYVGHDLAPDRVNWIAEGYEKLRNYSRARDVYQLTMDVWGNEKTDAIFQAQKQIGVLSVQLKDYEAAEEMTAKLKEDYAGQLELAVALRAIAHAWEEQAEESRSQQIHEYVVQQWPGSNEAMWSQRSLVLAKIKTDAPDTEQAVQAFLTEYAEQEKLAEAVYWLGSDSQYRCEDNIHAAAFYEYVTSHWPENRWAVNAGIALRMLQLDFEKNPADAVQSLAAEYPGQPVLTKLVTRKLGWQFDQAMKKSRQGQQEQAQMDYQAVLSGCQKVIQTFQVINSDTLRASLVAGECCRQLGQDEQAIGYYQTVAQHSKRNGADAAAAQYLVGKLYNNLSRDGVMDKTEAEEKTRQAYEQVLQKYPSSAVAGAARGWLEKQELLQND